MINKPESSTALFIVSGAIIVLLIILHVFKILSPIENVVIRIFSPFQKYIYLSGNRFSGSIKFFTSIKDLRKENKELNEKVNKLTFENSKLERLEKENKDLRTQLVLFKKEEFNLVTADVIGQDPNNLIQFININKGSADSIKENQPAIIANNFLIGKVSEVSSHSAKVILITDARSKINAQIQGADANGIIKGEHNLGLIMDMIPQDKIIKRGDKVITSGVGGDMPVGLYIGEVEEVKTTDNELFQTARIKTQADFKNLKIIFIILD